MTNLYILNNQKPTLNLEEVSAAAFTNFIKAIRSTDKANSTGWSVVQLVPGGGFRIVENLTRSAYVHEVPIEKWVFIVRLLYQGLEFDILLQRLIIWDGSIVGVIAPTGCHNVYMCFLLNYNYCRHKLYLVGYRVTHGGWVLLNGEYPERVSGCLRVSFPAFNERGNLIEPIQVDLGTSYSSLEKNSVGRENLKLNRWAIINAVNVLKHASLGMSFKKKICAIHILSLIQMIPEAVRIEEISSHISLYYLSNDNETRRLPASSIKMQMSWTKASRAIARWIFGMDFGTFWLNGVPLDVEEVIKKFPYIKGITMSELECD